jgi:hypothetical protein
MGTNVLRPGIARIELPERVQILHIRTSHGDIGSESKIAEQSAPTRVSPSH